MSKKDVKKVVVGSVDNDYMLVTLGFGKCAFVDLKNGHAAPFDAEVLTKRTGEHYVKVPVSMLNHLYDLGPSSMPSSDYDWSGNVVPASGVNKDKTVTEKNRFVEFVRYVRPLNADFEIDNMRGVTFAISLDYKKKKIEFGYAVCNGDNFNRKCGMSIAYDMLYNNPIKMKMVDGKISEDGAVVDIANNAWKKLNSQAQRQLLDTLNVDFA